VSAPSEPGRLKAFAHFFKSYMSLAALVTAALPVPVASLKLIPTFEAQTKFLSVYTSLFCFLMLAFLFQCRHSFARWMFLRPRRVVALLPLALILTAFALVLVYHATIESAVRLVQETQLLRGMPAGSTVEVLRDTDYLEIPHALRLAGTYLGFFLAAEAAFILMALREYLQDLLGLEERALIER
jgi:hypothetical protein